MVCWIMCITMSVLQPVGIACVTMCVGVLQPADSVPVGVHIYIVYCVASSVTIHWTGLPLPFPAFFRCRREANHVYSTYFFAEFAPLAC